MISLIIATINRRKELERLLQSLDEQSCRDFEVLIADQNPTGALELLLAAYRHLPIIHLPIAPQGASYARNQALLYVRGDIIGFPDDDCWYEPDTLAEVKREFTVPSVDAIFATWQDAGENFMPGKSCPLNKYSVFLHGETYVQFYRRNVIEAVGGFDETLGPGTGLPYGCGEDTDYALRAIDGKFRILRTPAVHVRHPRPDLAATKPDKLLRYATGRMYLLKKHHFSLGFKLLNVFYPLARLPLENCRYWKYRRLMFQFRLKNLFSCVFRTGYE